MRTAHCFKIPTFCAPHTYFITTLHKHSKTEYIIKAHLLRNWLPCRTIKFCISCKWRYLVLCEVQVTFEFISEVFIHRDFGLCIIEFTLFHQVYLKLIYKSKYRLVSKPHRNGND